VRATPEELERSVDTGPIVSVQDGLNSNDRTHIDVMEQCGRLDIAFIAWAPLDGGRLAGSAALEECVATRDARTWVLDIAPHIIVVPGAASAAEAVENVGVQALSARRA
jgi:aryl-alcohol dehydrogenase-like predicted oxidoreductase